MPLEIDCQGLPCPQPVINCKNAIEADSPEVINIIVDNEAAKENVSRFMGSKGYAVEVSSNGTVHTVTGRKSDSAPADECEECTIMNEEELAAISSKTLVFIDSEFLGKGDDELGEKLMFNFIATLPELGETLWRIIMVNSGVKLAAEGHSCLEKLRELEESGVSILVCGTCLDHFSLLEKRQIGQTTNMLDVVTSLQLASKVIKA